MKFGKTQLQIRMNHQLKYTTDIETRDFISDERRFQKEENKMLGVFLVFIYLNNIMCVRLKKQ